MIYFILFLNVVFTVTGQLLIKTGVNNIGAEQYQELFKKAVTNPPILSGFFLYFLAAALWIIILSKMELNTAYPSVAIGYVLIALFSWLLLGESINAVKILGMSFVVIGVILILRFSNV